MGGELLARIHASVTFADATLSGDEDKICAPLLKN